MSFCRQVVFCLWYNLTLGGAARSQCRSIGTENTSVANTQPPLQELALRKQHALLELDPGEAGPYGGNRALERPCTVEVLQETTLENSHMRYLFSPLY